MTDNLSHEMVLDKTYPTGAEEWYCPTCGRRLIMQWPPKYKRIILNSGDEHAAHSGGKGGVKISNFQVTNAEDPPEDLDLSLWEERFSDVDFDKESDDAVQ